MNLPPPNPAWQPAARRVVRPRRRRLGWILIGIGALWILINGFTVIRTMIGLFTSFESTRVPGSVMVDCDDGDDWRIGPATGSRDEFGPLTVGTERSISLDLVTVEVDGRPVDVRGMGDSRETFDINGTTYTAVATFTCPSNGEATITFTGPDGIVAGVFPSFSPVLPLLLMTVLVGVIVMVVLTVGIILAVLHRRSLERSPVAG